MILPAGEGPAVCAAVVPGFWEYWLVIPHGLVNELPQLGKRLSDDEPPIVWVSTCRRASITSASLFPPPAAPPSSTSFSVRCMNRAWAGCGDQITGMPSRILCAAIHFHLLLAVRVSGCRGFAVGGPLSLSVFSAGAMAAAFSATSISTLATPAAFLSLVARPSVPFQFGVQPPAFRVIQLPVVAARACIHHKPGLGGIRQLLRVVLRRVPRRIPGPGCPRPNAGAASP